MVHQSTSLKLKDTLIAQILPRYFAVPQVKEWLLDRRIGQPQASDEFVNGLSYACMYYPLSSLPPGLSAPFPLAQPFLDIGDFILCQKFYNGIAVGTVFKEQEKHALATLRDHLFPPSSYLSPHPCVRRFAVDTRKDYLEIIEFAWMIDHSLVVSCRQMRPANDGNHGNYFWGDILYYRSLPEFYNFDLSPYLWLSLRESPTACFNCNGNDISECSCPPSLRQKLFSPRKHYDSTVGATSNNSVASSSVARDENRLLETWRNYHKNVFANKQAGSFYATWYAQDHTNDIVLIRNPSQPIHYQFVTGSEEDTFHLIARYLDKSRIGQAPWLTAGTFSFGAAPPERQSELPEENNPSILVHANLFFPNEAYAPLDEQGKVENEKNCLTYPSNQHSEEVSAVGGAQTERSSHSQLPAIDPVPCTTKQLTVNGDRQDQIVTPNTECTQSPANSAQSVPSSLAMPYTYSSLPSLMGDYSNIISASAGNIQMTRSQPPESPPTNEGDQETKKFMTHDGNNDPMCAKCHRSFRKRGNLVRHIENVHLKKKPYRCRLCLTKFGYNYHLKRHYQSKHQVAFDHKCPVCGHDAGNNASLAQHMFKYHRVGADQVIGSQVGIGTSSTV